jgi:hypothetical protein
MASSAKSICRILPRLGAFITIVALTASTLSQRTVYYLPGMAALGNATIPWTSVYNATSPATSWTSFSAGAAWGANIKNAGYTGLWTIFTKEIEPLPRVCSTGNCTWLRYQSLGVCAQMSDMSNLIMKHDAVFNELVRKLPNGVYLNISVTSVSAITSKEGIFADLITAKTLASKTSIKVRWSRTSLSS